MMSLLHPKSVYKIKSINTFNVNDRNEQQKCNKNKISINATLFYILVKAKFTSEKPDSEELLESPNHLMRTHPWARSGAQCSVFSNR